MKIKDLYEYLNEKIPRSLSCEWDNDGLMCCPEPEREAKSVLVCLDITDEIVDIAVKGGFDAIVSHHPMIFKGITSVSSETGISGRLIKLIKSGISVMSFHTRFDAVDGGVNDTLVSLLELENVEKLECEGIKIGRVGNLKKEMTLSEFASLVKEKLSASTVSFSECSGKVFRVALVGGGGGDFVSEAAKSGADTFLSGTIGYHTMTDAYDAGVNLVEAGHYYTENPSCASLAKLVLGADKNINVEIFDSRTIFEI